MSYTLYRNILLIWIAVAVATFFISLFITAPYGRHSKSSWGIRINNQIGWIIMESTVLIVFYIVLALNDFRVSGISWLLIVCFTIHYIHRSFIFPFKIKNKNRQMPLAIMLFAMTFNLMNGWSLAYFFTHFASYNNSWIFDSRFLSGFLFFVIGMMINIRSDNQLIRLREENQNDYSVPRGNLFELISCPNHFGEIIEWLGFALMCWNLPALAFFIWTCANLIPRAIAHHHWYKKTFPEYPSDRKAVIPFLV